MMADTLSFNAKVDVVNFWVSQNWPSKMRNGIVHHKYDRKSCVIPTADRNNKLLYEDLRNKGFIGRDQLLSPEQREGDKSRSSPINN